LWRGGLHVRLRRWSGVRQVDAFLLQVENLVENEYREVPAALMDEIMRFLPPLSRKLMRRPVVVLPSSLRR